MAEEVKEVISLVSRKKEESGPLKFKKGQVVCLQSDKVAMTVAKVSAR